MTQGLLGSRRARGGGTGAPARYRRKNSGTFWASGPMPEKFPGHFSAWLPGGGDPRGEAGGGQAGHRPPIAEKIRGIFQREAQDRKNSWGIFQQEPPRVAAPTWQHPKGREGWAGRASPPKLQKNSLEIFKHGARYVKNSREFFSHGPDYV